MIDMKKTSSLTVNFLVLTATVVLLFILTEITLRIFTPNMVNLRLMHKPDGDLGFRLVPGFEMAYRTAEFNTTIKINSEGLRDHEYTRERDPQTFRILALGDSFTLGIGVDSEQTYAKVLESMLNRDRPAGGPKRFEVVNAGVDAYGTEQEYRYLRELLGRYRPDLVMVGLYSNDVSDVMGGIPTLPALGSNRLYSIEYLRGLKFLLKKSAARDLNTELLEIYSDRYSPRFTSALERTKDYLVKIRDLSAAAGAKTVILILPLCFEIDRSHWEVRGYGHLYTEEFFRGNMQKFSDTFVEFGKQLNIPTVPLLPVMRGSKTLPLYFAQDVHWTPEGHRLAAETMGAYLRKRDLIGRQKRYAQ